MHVSFRSMVHEHGDCTYSTLYCIGHSLLYFYRTAILELIILLNIVQYGLNLRTVYNQRSDVALKGAFYLGTSTSSQCETDSS